MIPIQIKSATKLTDHSKQTVFTDSTCTQGTSLEPKYKTKPNTNMDHKSCPLANKGAAPSCVLLSPSHKIGVKAGNTGSLNKKLQNKMGRLGMQNNN